MNRRGAQMAEAAKAFAIVANLFGAVLVFGGVGYALDWKLGSGFRYTIIGLGVGLLVGFFMFIREALKLKKRS